MTVPERSRSVQEASWKALVRGDGYLSPDQRQVFEQAIGMVSECLRVSLGAPVSRGNGHFRLESHVDGLEATFKRDAGGDELRGNAALTAFWIVRVLAERLLEVAREPSRTR